MYLHVLKLRSPDPFLIYISEEHNSLTRIAVRKCIHAILTLPQESQMIIISHLKQKNLTIDISRCHLFWHTWQFICKHLGIKYVIIQHSKYVKNDKVTECCIINLKSGESDSQTEHILYHHFDFALIYLITLFHNRWALHDALNTVSAPACVQKDWSLLLKDY